MTELFSSKTLLIELNRKLLVSFKMSLTDLLCASDSTSPDGPPTLYTFLLSRQTLLLYYFSAYVSCILSRFCTRYMFISTLTSKYFQKKIRKLIIYPLSFRIHDTRFTVLTCDYYLYINFIWLKTQ